MSNPEITVQVWSNITTAVDLKGNGFTYAIFWCAEDTTKFEEWFSQDKQAEFIERLEFLNSDSSNMYVIPKLIVSQDWIQ